MAKVVFALTAAQVKALVEISKTGENGYADYGTASGLEANGWLKRIPNKSGAGYWREKRKLTRRGRLVLALVRELKLDRIPAKAEASP